MSFFKKKIEIKRKCILCKKKSVFDKVWVSTTLRLSSIMVNEEEGRLRACPNCGVVLVVRG